MLSRDEDILKAAEAWRKAGRGVALATVVETWGSAPRPVGSHLVIDDEGNFLGLGVGRLRRGRGGDRGHRRDRRRQAEDAGIRRRRRDRLARRALLRRHASGSMSRRWTEVKLDILHALNAERAARRAVRRRHRCGERRGAAGQGRPMSPAIRCDDLIEKRFRIGQERHGRDVAGPRVPHRARAAAAAGRHRRGAYQPDAGADGADRSAST